jgi:peroxiredoxin Q/BCP
MRALLVRSVALLAIVGTPLAAQMSGGQGAAEAPAPVAPAVGDWAPDFTAPVAGASGVAAEPVKLSSLRGKVVVLAFYPADRTGGCTAELTKFRDENASLFGDGVVVLPISKDNLDSHASWAKDLNMPFVLVSDTAGTVARAYGSQKAPGKYFNRNVFVIGKDGKIAYSVINLNALSQDAYTSLGQAIAAAKKS